MSVILPDNYLLSDFLQQKKSSRKIFFKSEVKNYATLRLAIINIMPEAEKYEEYLLKLFVDLPETIEIVFVRVNNHPYKSSDKNHLDKFYVDFKQAILHKNIDGLIITGAPVELMEFDPITYYQELIEILNFANQNIKSTLGICWGGILIAHYLGIKNRILPQKLFGVYPAKYIFKSGFLDAEQSVFCCPQSRYAGIEETEIEEADRNGKINILCKSEEAGSYIFESSDHKFIGHLGHPEYEPERLIFEYERDRIKNLNHIPQYFDVNKPEKNWQQHADDFFSSWIDFIK